MANFLNKQTTISKIEEETTDKIKLRDADNVLYTLWKKKTDGNNTVAFEFWNKLPNKFMPLEISYVEKPFEFTNYNGEVINGTHKNITSFKWTAVKHSPTGEDSKGLRQSIVQSNVFKKEVDWAKIAEGKIRSLLVQAIVSKNGLLTLNKEDKDTINDLVEYCMGVDVASKTPLSTPSDPIVIPGIPNITDIHDILNTNDIINIDEIPF